MLPSGKRQHPLIQTVFACCTEGCCDFWKFDVEPEAMNIAIVGSRDFCRQVTSALELLQCRSEKAYHVVSQFIGRICEHDLSFVVPYEVPPTFYLSRTTAFVSITWCAGCIVHDAIHSRLYYESLNLRSPASCAWYGHEAELQCLAVQLEICEIIGAPAFEVRYLRTLNGQHFRLDHYW